MAKKTEGKFKRLPWYRITPMIPFPLGESQEEFDRLQKELWEQTDRGAAVLGASFLEWRVRQAIRIRLRVWDGNAERIFGTDERGGELGFSDQCRMAYCLGLVGKAGLTDLHDIAQIRNRFAHHLSLTSFSDQHISDKCKSLRTPELFHEHFHRIETSKPPTEPRHRYIATVNILHGMIGGVAVSGPARWPKVDGERMFW